MIERRKEIHAVKQLLKHNPVVGIIGAPGGEDDACPQDHKI